MNNTLKVVIGVGAALVVGLLVGYVLGSLGKRVVANTAKQLKIRVQEAEGELKQQGQECERKVKAAKTSKQVLLAKERLLWAMLELYANNYGLTSQHLAGARLHLKSAARGLKGQPAKLADQLHDRVGGAQTLAMRLDPMARVQIKEILDELQQLPGAR